MDLLCLCDRGRGPPLRFLYLSLSVYIIARDFSRLVHLRASGNEKTAAYRSGKYQDNSNTPLFSNRPKRGVDIELLGVIAMLFDSR